MATTLLRLVVMMSSPARFSRADVSSHLDVAATEGAYHALLALNAAVFTIGWLLRNVRPSACSSKSTHLSEPFANLVPTREIQAHHFSPTAIRIVRPTNRSTIMIARFAATRRARAPKPRRW